MHGKRELLDAFYESKESFIGIYLFVNADSLKTFPLACSCKYNWILVNLLNTTNIKILLLNTYLKICWKDINKENSLKIILNFPPKTTAYFVMRACE